MRIYVINETDTTTSGLRWIFHMHSEFSIPPILRYLGLEVFARAAMSFGHCWMLTYTCSCYLGPITDQASVSQQCRSTNGDWKG